MRIISHKRNHYITFAFVATWALLSACGDDKTPTSFGSTDDPAFQEAQGAVNNFLDSVFVAVSSGLDSYNQVPFSVEEIDIKFGPINPGAGDYVNYQYTTDGWHTIAVAVNNTTVIWTVNDSIQFRAGGAYQESSTAADQMDYRHRWEVIAKDQAADYTNVDGTLRVTIDGLNTTLLEMNGTYAFHRFDHSVTDANQTDNDFAVDATFLGITVEKTFGAWGPGCPSGGTTNFTMAQSKSVTPTGGSATVTDISWTGTVRWKDGMATVFISDGTTTWNYSYQVCGAPAS